MFIFRLLFFQKKTAHSGCKFCKLYISVIHAFEKKALITYFLVCKALQPHRQPEPAAARRTRKKLHIYFLIVVFPFSLRSFPTLSSHLLILVRNQHF
jgi:hypothetical protein